MCGICGLFTHNMVLSPENYYQAHKKMRHRGPDDEGFVVVRENKLEKAGVDKVTDSLVIGEVAGINGILSHTRLSIIDLTDKGHQPFLSEDNRIALVFNGEIYNYKELRQELSALGHIFCTESDTEVVLRSYEEWGEDCFNRFNGMWALGIYDARYFRLLLSRDRFGLKPLFYYYDGDSFCFASEIKVICNLVGVKSINANAVRRYIERCRLCDGKETFIENVYEVLPAHNLDLYFDKWSLKEKKYWLFTPSSSDCSANPSEELKALFEDAVRLRMRSDVEVGSLLSGGLDSNMIVGQLGESGLLSPDYKTFSAIYSETEYSEKKWIDRTVEKWNIQSFPIIISADEILKNLDATLYECEYPTRSAAVMIQYMLYKKISEIGGIKVVINGQGADECFGGYGIHYFARFYELICSFKWRQFSKELGILRDNRTIGNKELILGMLSHLKYGGILKNSFNDITFHQLNNPLREYLMYDDRMAMAWGIENRAPFLDYRIVEFAFSLGGDFKINEENNKWIERKVASNMIDESILNRKDKMGFSLPQEIWQQKEWKNTFDTEFEAIRRNGVPEFGNSEELYSEWMTYKENGNIGWGRIWRIFCMSRYIQAFLKAI